MLKVPIDSDIDVLGSRYAGLVEEAVKDGGRYIRGVSCGRLNGDMFSKGFTFAVCTEFASLTDMEYYVKDCSAHKQIQLAADGMVEGVSSSWYYGHVENI